MLMRIFRKRCTLAKGGYQVMLEAQHEGVEMTAGVGTRAVRGAWTRKGLVSRGARA